MKNISILLIAAFTFSGSILLAQSKALNQFVNRIVYEQIDFKKTPGIIIGIVDGDSTHYYSYGETAFGNHITPDENTLFEIGSLTKVFTASILQLMVTEGKINYDDPVSKYIDLPNLKYKDQEMTIGDLAKHFSGLPKLPYNFGSKERDARNPYAYYTNKDLYNFLIKYRPNTPPGSDYLYSHLGYVILSRILELEAQKSLPNLYSDYLFRILGMDRTKININNNDPPDIAQGYSLLGESVGMWSFQSFEGALGLKSTPADLMSFMKANLSEENTGLVGSLTETHLKRGDTDKNTVSVGYGWHIVQPRKNSFPVIAHSGVTEGHRAFMGFVRETQTGVIVLTNSEHNHGVGGFILQFLNKNFKRKE